MRTSLEVRFIGGERIRQMLTAPSQRERVFIALASVSSPAGAVIVRDPVEVPADAFVHPSKAVWSHQFTMAQVARAKAHGMGICILHSHGSTGCPRLSRADRDNFALLGPSIQGLHPTMLVASIVVSGDWHATGLMLAGGGAPVRVVDVARWYTSFVEVIPPPSPVLGRWSRGARHLPVWGEVGEARIRDASIGVVGLGGGGKSCRSAVGTCSRSQDRRSR